jgi:hypothetical protein
MNDRDRAEWVSNDESLYLDQRRSRLSVTEYVRRNRRAIDAAIRSIPGTEALFRHNRPTRARRAR